MPGQQLPQRHVIARPQAHGQQPDAVVYDVEHVWTDESGKQVRQMPVLIDGKTVWVECVDQQAQNNQDQVILDPNQQDFNSPAANSP